MPEQLYRNRQWGSRTSAAPQSTANSTTDTDLQDTVGNSGVSSMVGTDEATTGTDSAVGTQWASGAAAMAGVTATQDEEPAKPQMAAGTRYVLRADDIQWQESATWTKIARDSGLSAEHLVAFNQHVETVDQGLPTEHQETSTPTLAAGVEIYIPSSDEIAFSQMVHRASSMDEAVAEWGRFENSSNRKILAAARERASGKLGQGYGTAGVGGVFYTENPELAGASNKRTETINGEKEYKIAWGADFWKCSIFMNDVVYSAGYKPDVTDNKHYRLAGQLHQSAMYREVKVDRARPGNVWQRYGGSGSDESHNAVLSSYVTVEDIDDEWERWTFDIIGAESERAAESTRTHTIKKGTNQNNQGKRIRFFEPKNAR